MATPFDPATEEAGKPDWKIDRPKDLSEEVEWTGTDQGLGKKWLVHLPKTDHFAWFRKKEGNWRRSGGWIRGTKNVELAQGHLDAWKKKHAPLVQPDTPVHGAIPTSFTPPAVSLEPSTAPVGRKGRKVKSIPFASTLSGDIGLLEESPPTPSKEKPAIAKLRAAARPLKLSHPVWGSDDSEPEQKAQDPTPRKFLGSKTLGRLFGGKTKSPFTKSGTKKKSQVKQN